MQPFGYFGSCLLFTKTDCYSPRHAMDFMSLAEIRLPIYANLLIYHEDDGVIRFRTVGTHDGLYFGNWEFLELLRSGAPDPAILRVSKRVHCEAVWILYSSKNSFFLVSESYTHVASTAPLPVAAFLNKIGATNDGLLRRVRLSLRPAPSRPGGLFNGEQKFEFLLRKLGVVRDNPNTYLGIKNIELELELGVVGHIEVLGRGTAFTRP